MAPMKVQVWGSRGMLGAKVVRQAAAAGHTVLTGLERIERAEVRHIFGDVVINCAGVTSQRISHSWTSFMWANAVGPHNLAQMVQQTGARLIHVSTDCVFEGHGPHNEEAVPDADGAYARSKRAGEVTYGQHLTVRTSFVGFGSRGLIHELQTRNEVAVSNELLWTGHTVDTVAAFLVWLVDNPHVMGLLHMPGTGQTRFTLARDLRARWDLPARLKRDDRFVADRRLSSIYWAKLGLPILPPFDVQLETMRGP